MTAAPEKSRPAVLIPMSLCGHMSLGVESAKRVIADGDKNPYWSEAQKVVREGVHWIPS